MTDRGRETSNALGMIRALRETAKNAIGFLSRPEGSESRARPAFMDEDGYIAANVERFHDPDEAEMVVALNEFLQATEKWAKARMRGRS